MDYYSYVTDKYFEKMANDIMNINWSDETFVYDLKINKN